LVDYFEKWYGQAKKPHYGTTIAAGRAGNPEAQAELVRLAGETLYPAIVRATALSLLGSYPGDESTAAFQRALADEEALVRHTAVSHADALGLTPERLTDLLTPLLFDPVRAVRMLAVSKLVGISEEFLKPYQKEALQETLLEYEKAMEYSLDFSFAGHNLGNLYARLGESEKAETYYRSAIEIDGLFYPAKANLAMLYNSMGRNEDAEVLLREILEDYPDMYEAAYSLGLLMGEMNRYPDAADYLTRASEGMPTRSRVHFNLGLVLQYLARTAEAEAALTKALDLEPDNLDYLYGLADHYLKRGELSKALAITDRMIVSHPDNNLGRDLRENIERALRSGPRK
jgi:tetratricopeptide (TPR) repeat protein